MITYEYNLIPLDEMEEFLAYYTADARIEDIDQSRLKSLQEYFLAGFRWTQTIRIDEEQFAVLEREVKDEKYFVDSYSEKDNSDNPLYNENP